MVQALIGVGVLCAAYGTCIMLTRTGSRFYLMWYGAAVAYAGTGALLAAAETGAIPAALPAARVLALGMLALLAAYALTCLGVMGFARRTRRNAPGDLAFLVVLGAQVNPSGEPSRALRYRLEAARAYLQAHPRARTVVSGGQGPNEPCTEARAMAVWLCRHGVEPRRVLQEDRSTTTAENLVFSRQVIAETLRAEATGRHAQARRPAQAPSLRNGAVREHKKADRATSAPEHVEPARVGIVTSDFHLYRALRLARQHGYAEPQGIVAASTPWRLPHNLLRECLALLKSCLIR